MDPTARLERLYTGAVHDVLHERGHSDCTLPTTIRPLDPGRPLAGKVFTAEGRRVEGVDKHESLLRWTEFLSEVPPESVVICQANDSTIAHMGELSAETLLVRGARGFIIDGGCRDSEFILRSGFRVFCRYYTPADVVARWVVESTGEPITIGKATINTGDYTLADRDGVVIVPGEWAAEVTDSAEEVLHTENKVRKAILAGMDPREAYLKFRKF